jgi:hypothetical protein
MRSGIVAGAVGSTLSHASANTGHEAACATGKRDDLLSIGPNASAGAVRGTVEQTEAVVPATRLLIGI